MPSAACPRLRPTPPIWLWMFYRPRSSSARRRKNRRRKIMTSPHTPRRIVCLQPSATVILAAVGELDRVVACTKYCADVVPEIVHSSRLILADSWTANTEEIVAARPDLVIASVPYQE